MNSTESIVAKVYDLLKFCLPLLNKLPKTQRFFIGDRIQNQLADLLEIFIEAYYSPNETKRGLLVKANVLLEKLRYYFRLCYDLGFINSVSYKDFASRLDEIGRMNGGWLKSLKN